MAITVVNQWSASLFRFSGFFVPAPACNSLDIPVANSGAPGNWLIAILGWRQPQAAPAEPATMAVGDDVGQLWEPVGAPNGTSSSTGQTRVSIWSCASAQAAEHVFVSPNNDFTGGSVLILEVAGLSPWMTLTAIVTNLANAANSLPVLSLAAPSAQALLITAACTDNDSATISGPGIGWTALPTVTGTNGTDHTADTVLSSAYQVTTGAVTATWAQTGGPVTQDWSGILAGILVTGTAPTAPSQKWPLVRLQAAFGAGAQTPWDQATWTDLTSRYRGMSSSRGKQYELDVIQAGTSNWTLSNNDGSLTPGFSGSPYYPNVEVYTPVRLLVTWPPPPAANAKTYCVIRHYMERWPQARTAARYQNANGVSTDVWALLTPQQVTIARLELGQDSPYALWPLDDPANSTTGRNLAATGSGPIQLVTSKYGAGTAVSAFGSNSDYLVGDPSSTNWEQSVVPASETEGYTLYYSDPNLPAISNGVTIEGWFSLATSQPTGANLALMAVRNPKGPVAAVYVQQSTGKMFVDVYDKITQAKTTTQIGVNTWLSGAGQFHVALAFSQTGWTCYVDGGSFGATSGSCNFANSPYWLSFNGAADRLGTGSFFNGTVGLLAVYPLVILQTRIVAHYWAGLTGIQAEDTPSQRMERLLGGSNCAFPRTLNTSGYDFQGALDIAQQAVSQNVTNVAESDNGMLLVNGAGYLRYLARGNGWNLPVSWTFGEQVAAPLNANWGFEAGTSPWTAQNNATLSRSSLWSQTGQFSALWTGNGATASPQITSEDVAVTPGTSYTAQSWFYSPQGWTTGVQVSVVWKNASHTQISVTTGTLTTLTAASPVLLTAAARAPAAAAFAAVVLAASGTPASTVQFLADQAMITTTATEYPYGSDFATDYDPSQVFNDIELDQLAAPATIGATATGVTILLTSAASIAQFGDQTLQETIYSNSVQAIVDLASWIVNTMGRPQTRIAVMTLDPAANPALWPVVLSLESGQVIQVNNRLGGTLLDMSGQFQIMTVGHANAPGVWKTTIAAVTYNGNALTCDSVVNGVLDGQPRLAW